jgi:hypothetical protein
MHYVAKTNTQAAIRDSLEEADDAARELTSRNPDELVRVYRMSDGERELVRAYGPSPESRRA